VPGSFCVWGWRADATGGGSTAEPSSEWFTRPVLGLALRVATLHRSLVTLRACRYVNVPAFVAVRLTLWRFRNLPAVPDGRDADPAAAQRIRNEPLEASPHVMEGGRRLRDAAGGRSTAGPS